ncbi:hypothetical protein BVI1335_1010087 [Burkholderia vietnamiensis]|nr:hypothetical protein BVI1335_1010087 [Burkholderia vietnamiensis]
MEAHRRRSAHREPQRLRVPRRQQDHGHVDLHARQVRSELREMGVLPLPRRLLHHHAGRRGTGAPEGRRRVRDRAGHEGNVGSRGDGAQVLRVRVNEPFGPSGAKAPVGDRCVQPRAPLIDAQRLFDRGDQFERVVATDPQAAAGVLAAERVEARQQRDRIVLSIEVDFAFRQWKERTHFDGRLVHDSRPSTASAAAACASRGVAVSTRRSLSCVCARWSVSRTRCGCATRG